MCLCHRYTREIFGALVLFNNFVFLRFVHDCTIMVSFEVRSSFSYRHVETRRLHFEREKTQFTMFAGIFYTKTTTMVILRINMRRERRCSEIFRWSLVSQLSEISSVVQPFLFSQLLHVLFSLAYFYFLQKSNGFCHDAVRYLASSLLALYNATRSFCVRSWFLQSLFSSSRSVSTDLAFSCN